MFVYPKNPTALEIISVGIQLAFNYWVYQYIGKFVVYQFYFYIYEIIEYKEIKKLMNIKCNVLFN